MPRQQSHEALGREAVTSLKIKTCELLRGTVRCVVSHFLKDPMNCCTVQDVFSSGYDSMLLH